LSRPMRFDAPPAIRAAASPVLFIFQCPRSGFTIYDSGLVAQAFLRHLEETPQ
jgi:hypothetical protein